VGRITVADVNFTARVDHTSLPTSRACYRCFNERKRSVAITSIWTQRKEARLSAGHGECARNRMPSRAANAAALEPFSCRRRFGCYFEDDFLGGTLAPARRASESPIAIACFRLLTFLPELPLFSVPALRSCMTFLTFSDAFFPYFAIAFSLS